MKKNKESSIGMKVIGMAPGSAVAFVTGLYDKTPESYRLKLLLNERVLPKTIKGRIVKEFSSRKTMDINAGELLGLGVVGAYFNESNKKFKKSYQVVVGVDDSAKPGKENVLSDGAIWENQTRKKMPFQQTLAQGYFPETAVDKESLKKVIEPKILRRKRGDFPNNCGLIVNVFANEVNVDLSALIKECEIEVFNSVYVIFYELPGLTRSLIYLLDKRLVPQEIEMNKMSFKLERFKNETDWQINEDESKF